MLAPGPYHQEVPRDLEANLAFRVRLLEAAAGNPELQRGLVEMCRQDILFWICAFVVTVDPRKRKKTPFITWPAQERAMVGGIDPWTGERVYGLTECIRDGTDVQIEKSRDEGGTLLALLAMIHPYLFGEGFYQFLVMSRNEQMVLGKSPKSLFKKIDFILAHLPDWMKPRLWRQKEVFVNLDNEATINGEATTKKTGVGDRPTAMLLDEFSQLDDARETYDRTNDTTDCRIFTYTHTGPSTMAAELANNPGIRRIVLHWSDDPRKNAGLYKCVGGEIELLDQFRGSVKIGEKTYSFPDDEYPFVTTGLPNGKRPGIRSPWYDNQCLRRSSDSHGVKMDLDIDPYGASLQFYDPQQIMRLVREFALPPLWEGDIEFDERTARPTGGLLPRRHGPLKLWITLREYKPAPAQWVMFVDLGRGEFATPSCASIINADTGEKAGHFLSADISPYEMASLAVALCHLFRTPSGDSALLGWEANGPGGAFFRRLDELAYRRVYCRNDPERASYDQPRNSKPGWVPTRNTKIILHNAYAEALYTGDLTNRSERALRETLGFIHDDGGVTHPVAMNIDKTEAFLDKCGQNIGGRDCHGEIVVADAGAWMLAKTFGAGRLPKAAEEDEPQIGIGTLAGRRRMHEDRQRGKDVWVR